MSLCTALHDWVDDEKETRCAQCGATQNQEYDSIYDTIWERDE